MSNTQSFRIIVWSVSSTGWRGDQKAVVFDAKSIGVEEYANDIGSAYWTLANDHPQLAEFVPLERHYEISRWEASRSRWEFVGAGMLNDYVITEEETIFSGIDYKYVLNQIFTPLSGVTLGSGGALNPNASTVDHKTIFNYSDLTTAKDEINGTAFDVNGQALYDVVDDATGKLTNFSITAVSSTTKTVTVGAYTAAVSSPYLKLKYSMQHSINTSGFQATPQFRLRINASPPGIADVGVPPIGEIGAVGEISVDADGTSGTNRIKVSDREVHLFPYAAKQKLSSALIGAGAAQSAIDAALLDIPTGTQGLSPMVAYSLRNGVSYSFQIYGGVYRSSNTRWYVFKTGKSAGSFILGQQENTVFNLVESAFADAKGQSAYERIRYASLSIDGSDGTTTHTVYSYGQPTLEFIGDICDLEMGARTDGAKAIFRIVKPTGSASYGGNFKLSLGVSSASISAGALRYPENIKQYTYAPNYARVKNDITLIDPNAMLSGSTFSTPIFAAQSSNSSLLSQYGRIAALEVGKGFATATDAQKEADRLLKNADPNNTRQVSISIVADGITIWDGWDVGDSIRVTIKHGAVNIDEPFVISGVRWFGNSDGSESLQLELVQGSSFATSFPAGFDVNVLASGGNVSGTFVG